MSIFVAQPDDPGNAEVLASQDVLHGVGGEVARLGDVGYLPAADFFRGGRMWM